MLDDLDFAPAPGRLTAVLGASGSGKSTLLNALSGLIRPGRRPCPVRRNGRFELGEGRRDRWRRDHIGLVFQNFHLIEELGPRDNVMLAAWFDRLSAAKLRGRADALLEGLGVPAQRNTCTGCRAASSSASPSPGP